MIASSHVIIGGTVGLLVSLATQNPAIALVAGFVSHLMCDLVPHIDHPDAPKLPSGDLVFTKKVYIFAIADSMFAFFFILACWGILFDFDLTSTFAWGALGAYLPDFIDNVPLWRFQVRTLPGLKQFHNLHRNIHLVWQKHLPMPEHYLLGTISQLIFVIPALWYIFSGHLF